ncbi:unnamed protein product [Closterium sp. NIES-64]|nr:unnamed protein product [Closterium sp. NIES-64]
MPMRYYAHALFSLPPLLFPIPHLPNMFHSPHLSLFCLHRAPHPTSFPASLPVLPPPVPDPQSSQTQEQVRAPPFRFGKDPNLESGEPDEEELDMADAVVGDDEL